MSSLKGRVKRLMAMRRTDKPERLEITICGGLPPDPADPDPKIAQVVGEQGQTFYREPGEMYAAFQARVRMAASGAIIGWGGLPPIHMEDNVPPAPRLVLMFTNDVNGESGCERAVCGQRERQRAAHETDAQFEQHVIDATSGESSLIFFD
jgi:hypothetical protein